jgi:hypothetical protein
MIPVLRVAESVSPKAGSRSSPFLKARRQPRSCRSRSGVMIPASTQARPVVNRPYTAIMARASVFSGFQSRA